MAGEHLHAVGGAALRGQVQRRPPLVVPHVQVHQGFSKGLQGFTVTIVGLRTKHTMEELCLEELHPQAAPLGPSSTSWTTTKPHQVQEVAAKGFDIPKARDLQHLPWCCRDQPGATRTQQEPHTEPSALRSPGAGQPYLQLSAKG